MNVRYTGVMTELYGRIRRVTSDKDKYPAPRAKAALSRPKPQANTLPCEACSQGPALECVQDLADRLLLLPRYALPSHLGLNTTGTTAKLPDLGRVHSSLRDGPTQSRCVLGVKLAWMRGD